ncbi:Vam6/Vps39-like protein [Podochytrium sp. JEL0797]|nr:Vam6/Vps39-like protein [Podochytrium sp. JEL0797]
MSYLNLLDIHLTQTGNQFLSYTSTIVVPPVPAQTSGTETYFIWPGLQPGTTTVSQNFLPINNGVLQPVLTFGPTCAPGKTAQQAANPYYGWAISGQYVNTFGSAPGYVGCLGGSFMAVQPGDQLVMTIQLQPGTTTWYQKVTDSTSGNSVDFSIDMKGQTQTRALFAIELYGQATPYFGVVIQNVVMVVQEKDPGFCSGPFVGQTSTTCAGVVLSADGKTCSISSCTFAATSSPPAGIISATGPAAAPPVPPPTTTTTSQIATTASAAPTATTASAGPPVATTSFIASAVPPVATMSPTATTASAVPANTATYQGSTSNSIASASAPVQVTSTKGNNIDVFVVQCLVEALPMPISSFVSFGDKLVICSSGSVLLYAIAESPAFDIRLIDSKKGFSNKKVDQLSAVPEASLLLALEDGFVRVHNLSTLAFKESLTATKGATLMAVFPPPSTDAAPSNDSNGFTSNEILAFNGLLDENHSTSASINSRSIRSSITSRLIAVVVKKKILVYKTSLDGSVRLFKELTTPNRAHIMLWLNSNTIAYAHPKRGYFTVSLDTNAITELYKFNNSYFSVVSGSGMKLGIAELPKGQLMLTNHDSGVFVNADGSSLVERDLEWSGPPDFITFSAPYVVALISGSLEVRSLTTGGIVQRMEFRDSELVALGGNSLIHIANTNCIWRLLPVSFEDQIEYLIASNQFIEAQRLIEELDFASEEEKISNIIRVRGLYAHYTFTTEHKYEEAISLLSELRASPIDIVNLFPQFSLMGPNSEPPVTGFSSILFSKGHKFDIQKTDPVALAALKDYLILQRQTLSRLRRLHQRPSASIPFLHQAAARSINTEATITAPSLFSGSDYGVPDPLPFLPESSNAEDAVFLSSVVDTTLLKVYLVVNEALVGSLVRVENFCDLEESENALKARGKYRELIDFYYGKGEHRKALENLTEANGIEAYLQKLDINAHINLFTEFVEPVFERSVQDGMSVFIDRYEEIPLKTYLKILAFFEHKSPVLETQYLEHLIQKVKSEQPEFHDRLVLLYLQELVDTMAVMDGNPPQTGGRVLEMEDGDDINAEFYEMRKRLVVFLESSRWYRPERIVSLFPEDVLLEERTTVLGRLKRHTEALEICVGKLANYELAERYCEIHYSPSDTTSKDIFITLLSLLLDLHKSSAGAKIGMDQIVDFVVRYGGFIDGTKAVHLLPATLPLSNVVAYFDKALSELHFAGRNSMVGLGVAKMEHINVQEQLIEAQHVHVTIHEDTLCARCRKKIAGSVFAAYTKDLVVHVFCMTK